MARKILIVSPHTDDGELGCGGAAAKFIEEGDRVDYVALSCCEKSVPPEYPADILVHEVKAATRILGIDNPVVLDFEVRDFPGQRQKILDALIVLRREIEPDIVFAPSRYDTHQDHKTTIDEVMRAFKNCTILGFEQPWNNITFNTLAFIPITKDNLGKKIRALKCYKTQLGRNYFNEEFIRGLAVTRGTQIEVPFAEAFEVIKWVITRDVR